MLSKGFLYFQTQHISVFGFAFRTSAAILGCPEVSVSPVMKSVTLTMKLPVGPDNRASLEELQREHREVIISYTVKLTPAEQVSTKRESKSVFM